MPTHCGYLGGVAIETGQRCSELQKLLYHLDVTVQYQLKYTKGIGNGNMNIPAESPSGKYRLLVTASIYRLSAAKSMASFTNARINEYSPSSDRSTVTLVSSQTTAVIGHGIDKVVKRQFGASVAVTLI
jgi:hypothetical protein